MHFNGKLNQNIYVVHIRPFPLRKRAGETRAPDLGARYRKRRSNMYSRILVRGLFLKVTLPSRGSKSRWKKLIKAILQSQSASHLVSQADSLWKRLCVKGYFTPCPLTNGRGGRSGEAQCTRVDTGAPLGWTPQWGPLLYSKIYQRD